jgi:hypothetical protein
VLGAAHVRSRIQWLRRVVDASKSVCDFESCSDPVGVISTVSFPKIPALRSSQSMLRSKKWSWLKAWAMQVRRCRMKKAIVALARRALQELAGLPKIIT